VARQNFEQKLELSGKAIKFVVHDRAPFGQLLHYRDCEVHLLAMIETRPSKEVHRAKRFTPPETFLAMRPY
jgi:hypothetical protein